MLEGGAYGIELVYDVLHENRVLSSDTYTNRVLGSDMHTNTIRVQDEFLRKWKIDAFAAF